MKIEKTENPLPDEDYVEHERSYEFFLRLVAIAVCHVLSCLLAVAIGGLFGHWYLAFLWFVVATVAAGAGIALRQLSWKPSALALAITLVSFAATA